MTPKKVGIVGIHGKFGRWFEKFFSDRDCNVVGTDVDTKASLRDVVEWADVVVFCASLDSMEKVIGEAADYSRKGQLFIDIASVKALAVNAMARSNAEYVGLHPLFAPSDANTWKGLTLVVSSPSLAEWSIWFSEFLDETEADVRLVSPDVHDEYMTVEQNTPHAMHLAHGLVCKSMGFEPEMLRALSTKVSRREFATLSRMLSNDPKLYVDMMLLNPICVVALNELIRELTKIRDDVERDDREALIGRFEDLRSYLGDEFVKKGLEDFGN